MTTKTKFTYTRRAVSRFAGAVAGAVMLASPGWADVPESTDPIHLSIHDHVGSHFMSTLAKRLLEKAGYNVELVMIGETEVLLADQTGDISFQIETWTSTHPELQPMIDEGKLTLVGETGLVGKDRWWYPLYVKELCPGLPDWHALKDCAEVFATPETGDKGRFLGYPDNWGGWDEERIA
ncbi:MAG: hypothetical protein IT551_11925, partial [Novosphingobium sp.]|nr:hypothetical protein [Novosphingobium sp.]